MILHIKAVGAIDIPKMDTFGKADPYLKITDNKSQKTYKTSYCKQTYTPIWDEEFHIPVENNAEDFIHFSLIDWDPFPKHDLISTRDFPISSFEIGRVTDNFYDFFPANKVKKPGKVHLVFHLALPDQKPFENTKKTLHSLPTVKFAKEQQENLQEAFDEIDQDHSGSIDLTETKGFLEKIGINSCFAPLAFEICGKKLDSSIKFDEFKPFYEALNNMNNDKLCIYRILFDKFDADHSGFLDKSEVVKLLCFFGGDDWDEDDAERFIENHDTNNDGQLDFEELCELIEDEMPRN